MRGSKYTQYHCLICRRGQMDTEAELKEHVLERHIREDIAACYPDWADEAKWKREEVADASPGTPA